ncbi:MAG: NTF2-like N-terminal transpeptidase domain-containing protein [Candidatus Pacearchaeota archaeon]|jgi:hypothetical protein
MEINYNKLAVYVIATALIVTISIVFYTSMGNNSNKIITEDDSAKAVREYFNAWDKKDYGKMYQLISDGFKDNETTAKNFLIYKTYMNSQDVNRVRTIELMLIDKEDSVARIEYSIELISKKGLITPLNEEFTLKYFPNSTIPGWKLIHPYGNFVDN